MTGVPLALVDEAPLDIVQFEPVILTEETEAPRAFVTVHVAFAVDFPATKLPDNPPLLAVIAPHDTDGLIADVLIVIFADPVFVPIRFVYPLSEYVLTVIDRVAEADELIASRIFVHGIVPLVPCPILIVLLTAPVVTILS